MCLIIAAPKGTEKKSDFLFNAIKTAALTNKDGVGLMYKEGDSIYVDKGYKSAEEIIDVIKGLSLSDEHGELAVHLRIGNKGAVNSQMCHPFICSNDDDETLLLQAMTKKPVLMHNGTFSGLTLPVGKSDTFVFANKLMSNYYLQEFLANDPSGFKDAFSSVLSVSRVLMFFPEIDRDSVRLGNWFEENGYYFSNETYKNSKIKDVGGVQVSLYEDYMGSTACLSRRTRSRAKYSRSSMPKTGSTERKVGASTSTSVSTINNSFISYPVRTTRVDYLSKGVFKSGSVRDTFEDILGFEYSTYVGLYKGITDNRDLSDEVLLEPFINKYNFKYLTLQSKITDSSIGIRDSVLYKATNILYNKTTNESIVVINKAVGPIMEDSIYINLEEIAYYFSVTPANNDIARGLYRMYLDAVSELSLVNKNLNRMVRVIKGKNPLEMVSYGKNDKYQYPAVIFSWLVYEAKRYQGATIKRIRQVLQDNE